MMKINTLLVALFYSMVLSPITYSNAFCVQPALSNQRQATFKLLSSEEELTESQTEEPPVPCPDCDLCDGSGRIAGGIGAILPWIPIKAYRPCPQFIERGGRYTRTGQPLDEIAFGRGNVSKEAPDDDY